MTEQIDAQVEAPAQAARPLQSIRVTVNHQPVELPVREMTGLEIKEAAVAQGVEIQLDFPLSFKRGNHFVAVGDDETIRVHENQEFLAVPPDDNS